MESRAVCEDPSAEYSHQVEVQRLEQSSYEHRHRQLGSAKLVVALTALIIVIWALASRAISILWVLLPILAFVLLDTIHGRTLRSLQRCSRIIAFYERGIARLENRWMGQGETGESFLDPSHLYSRDLDLFGKGSLFELLCTARTRAGQGILAQWLLHTASLSEIHERHGAIAELRSRLDLREDLAVFGEDLRSRVHPDALATWAEGEPILKPVPVRAVAVVLSGLWLLSLVVWAVWGLWELALASSAMNWMFSSRFKARVERVAPAPALHANPVDAGSFPAAPRVETIAPDLAVLAGVLARLELEDFSAPKLVKLQSGLKLAETPPSRSIARLRRLVECLESRRNMFVSAVDPFILWTLQIAFAIEGWRKKFGPAIRGWLVAVGEIEALSALAGYAYEHPADVFPEFTTDDALFQAEGLAHPLLPESQAVRNDLSIGGELRLMIISGPNMAGKSTLVRAVGTNAVLAQCGAPVRARRLRLSLLAVTASICVLDSLQGGISRFYAEITRLKLIAELTRGPLPVLFLLDELLNGTNSHDRCVGAEAVAKSLVARGAIGLITTHDLGLAQIVDNMKSQAANFHFEDRLENGELRFDYRLIPGLATTSNALKLMRSIGLDV